MVHFHIRSVNQQIDEIQSAEKPQVCRRECAEDTQRRLGLAVSKAVGNAVARNHVKRRLRVLAKHYETLLPQYCDVVIRAKPTANHVSFAQLDQQIARTFTSIAHKATKHESAKHTVSE
ncbi:hypothetical protein GCM10007377_14000 [Galliscardovia ingluviei]|uniref:Ribonuclease P protein component n=1 Tax=Galliscardovia ingluviei TaxID=1769422 RepID=A0A8J3AJN9_9BIFI|nr:hypothetical protein GCM10007377_14000 [Galliscardovia ingluviei]